MWLRDKRFNQAVVEAWNCARIVESGLKEKLKCCSESIISWNGINFSDIRKKIKARKEEYLNALKNTINQQRLQLRKKNCQSTWING